MIDPILDKSPQQKRFRVEKLRAELKELGYSVVPTTYLIGLMVEARRKPLKRHKVWVERRSEGEGAFG